MKFPCLTFRKTRWRRNDEGNDYIMFRNLNHIAVDKSFAISVFQVMTSLERHLQSVNGADIFDDYSV